jgi:hypothetical protein
VRHIPWPLWIVKNTPLRSTTNQNEIFNHNLIWHLINQSGPLHCDFKNKPKLNKSALLYTYGIETKALFFECLSQDFTQKNWKYTFPLVCKKTVSLSWTVSYFFMALFCLDNSLPPRRRHNMCKKKLALLRASGSDKAFQKEWQGFLLLPAGFQ